MSLGGRAWLTVRLVCLSPLPGRSRCTTRADVLQPCLKMLRDVFARSKTASQLYTNDLRVLVDIILRNLVDLPEKDPLRVDYITLLHQLVRNSDYSTLKYRTADIRRIVGEIGDTVDSPASEAAKAMLKECNQMLA